MGPTEALSPLVVAFLLAPQGQCSVVFLAGTLPGRKMQMPTQIPSGCFTTSKSAWTEVSSRKGRAVQGGKRALCGRQPCLLQWTRAAGVRGADSPRLLRGFGEVPKLCVSALCVQQGVNLDLSFPSRESLQRGRLPRSLRCSLEMCTASS